MNSLTIILITWILAGTICARSMSDLTHGGLKWYEQVIAAILVPPYLVVIVPLALIANVFNR